MVLPELALDRRIPATAVVSHGDAEPIGHSSAASGPNGDTIVESAGTVTPVRIAPGAAAAARYDCPGCLRHPADLDAQGWVTVARRR